MLEDVLTRRGMTVMSRSRMESVARDGDAVTVTLTDGRTVTGSHCLLALGSVPNTAGIGLEEAGVVLDDAGFVKVDRVSRTAARGVYAAGDCTGVLMLASVAAMQGRIAMWHVLGDAVAPLDLNKVASNVFTAPEIATVGWSQHAVDTGEVQAEAIALDLAGNPRAKMQGVHDGFVKLFCRPGTGIVVGGVVVGPAGQRADPPALPGGRGVPHRRPARPGLHGLPLDERLPRRGGPPPAPPRPLTPLPRRIRSPGGPNPQSGRAESAVRAGRIRSPAGRIRSPGGPNPPRVPIRTATSADSNRHKC